MGQYFLGIDAIGMEEGSNRDIILNPLLSHFFLEILPDRYLRFKLFPGPSSLLRNIRIDLGSTGKTKSVLHRIIYKDVVDPKVT